jgi:outer membrane protein assembly factor BamB
MNTQGQLVALARNTGEWVWQQSDVEPSLFSLISRHGLQFFEGRLLAGFPSGKLQAHQPETGLRLWTDNFSMVGVDGLGLNDLRALETRGDYLVASSYGGDLRVWKSQAGSRRLLWEKSQSLHTAPQIDLAAGLVYISNREGGLQAVELETGFVRWEYAFPRGLGTQPVFSGNHLWVGTSMGELFVFDRTSGGILAQTRALGSSIIQAPMVIDDHSALVVTTKGILRRFQLKEI